MACYPDPSLHPTLLQTLLGLSELALDVARLGLIRVSAKLAAAKFNAADVAEVVVGDGPLEETVA